MDQFDSCFHYDTKSNILGVGEQSFFFVKSTVLKEGSVVKWNEYLAFRVDIDLNPSSTTFNV